MNRLPAPGDRRAERGFTLVELMIVVAIVAILAIVVVPLFTGEAKKVKAKTEVSAMFAELSAKQERYKNESGSYLAIPECPTPASATQKDVTPCLTAGTFPGDPWIALGIVPPEQKLRCSYEVYVGTSATPPTQPSGATQTTLPPSLAMGWYMIHARCDMDTDSTLAHFTTASYNAAIEITNEGE